MVESNKLAKRMLPPRLAMGCRPPLLSPKSDECEILSPPAKTVRESRTLALEAGWKMFDGRACCPKCLELVMPGKRADGMKDVIH